MRASWYEKQGPAREVLVVGEMPRGRKSDPLRCRYRPLQLRQRHRHALRIADTLLKRFSTNLFGKISLVHFFWGSFDLTVTRFNGKRAPARPGIDAVQTEAYSDEVISAGFWPGNGGYGRAAFHAYASPAPDGFQDTVPNGKGGFNPKKDPADTVLEFFADTYSAAADLANWDRAGLDRQDEVAGALRIKRPQSLQKPPR